MVVAKPVLLVQFRPSTRGLAGQSGGLADVAVHNRQISINFDQRQGTRIAHGPFIRVKPTARR
jgi:hypothetical protein